MENGPFDDVFSMKTGDIPGLAVLGKTRGYFAVAINHSETQETTWFKPWPNSIPKRWRSQGQPFKGSFNHPKRSPAESPGIFSQFIRVISYKPIYNDRLFWPTLCRYFLQVQPASIFDSLVYVCFTILEK